MFPAPLPDLDGLDPETLKALLIAKHNESLAQHKQLSSNSQVISVSWSGPPSEVNFGPPGE